MPARAAPVLTAIGAGRIVPDRVLNLGARAGVSTHDVRASTKAAAGMPATRLLGRPLVDCCR